MDTQPDRTPRPARARGHAARSGARRRRMFPIPPAATVVLSLASAGRLAAAPLQINPGDRIAETFPIGTDAAAVLPAGWRVDQRSAVRSLGASAEASETTGRRGGNALASNAAGGIYNFGAGPAETAEDRAVGFLSSGDGLKSGNLYLHLRNLDVNAITGLSMSYQLEKYRNGSNPDGFAIQLHYGTNGADWTSAGPEFHTFFPPDTNCNGYADAPGLTTGVVDRILAVTVPSGCEFHLAWNYSVASGTTTTCAQALALDDIRITALGEPGGPVNLPPVLNVMPEHQTVFTEREARATVTASDPNGDPVTLTVSSSNIPAVASCFDPTSGVLAWTPACPGEYRATFTAEDGRGGATRRDLTLQVVDDRTPQAGLFAWRFDSTEPTAATGTVGVGAGPVARVNSGQVTFLSTESVSSGYEGASGGGNGAAAVPAWSTLDPVTATRLEWSLTPDHWVDVTLSTIAFGSRSTASGPLDLALFSSLDGFAAPLATFNAATDGEWALHAAALTNAFRTETVFRLCAWNATGATKETNWRIDDLTLTFDARSCRPPTLLRVR